MPTGSHRGAAKSQRLQPASRLQDIHWDDIRIFLACVDAASFREAAKSLGLDSSTVTRRIVRLEKALDTKLFDRLPEGGRPTQTGIEMCDLARDMHRSICDLERRRSNFDPTERGEVTVAVTEGLGTFWVMPRIVELQRGRPNTVVNLLCAMESVDVLRLEADMAIQFIKPKQPDVVAVKLGRLHVYPFAARRYLETYGRPKNYADMVHHRLVEQVAPQLDGSALARYFQLESTDTVAAVRTNASTAHLYAIEKGAGIGVLPTFAMALGAPVEPIDIGDGYSRDVWLTFHPDIKASPHKAAVVRWIRSIFDRSVYPWFSDEFIHPSTLAQSVPESARINEGAGYLAVTSAATVPERRQASRRRSR